MAERLSLYEDFLMRQPLQAAAIAKRDADPTKITNQEAFRLTHQGMNLGGQLKSSLGIDATGKDLDLGGNTAGGGLDLGFIQGSPSTQNPQPSGRGGGFTGGSPDISGASPAGPRGGQGITVVPDYQGAFQPSGGFGGRADYSGGSGGSASRPGGGTRTPSQDDIRTQGLIDRVTQQQLLGQQSDIQSQADKERFERESSFQAEQERLRREQESRLPQEEFQRRTEFLQPFLESLGGLGGDSGDQFGGLSDAEAFLIEAQREAGDREINRLQDVLSEAGILSSGTLSVGTGEILGRTRGQIAQSLAQAAENRITRRYQERMAQQQQIVNLVNSILL